MEWREMRSLIWKEEERLLNRDSCIFTRFVQETKSVMERAGENPNHFSCWY
jgi:hypothetical protein